MVSHDEIDLVVCKCAYLSILYTFINITRTHIIYLESLALCDKPHEIYIHIDHKQNR